MLQRAGSQERVQSKMVRSGVTGRWNPETRSARLRPTSRSTRRNARRGSGRNRGYGGRIWPCQRVIRIYDSVYA